MTKWLILLFFIPITTNAQDSGRPYGGTTVLVYLTKDSVWMATDSQRGVKGQGAAMNQTICKIVNVGNYIAAVEGDFTGYKFSNNSLLYDARFVIRDAILMVNNPASMIKIITDTIRKYTEWVLKNDINMILSINEIINKKRLLEIALVTFINNDPILMTISFTITGTTYKWNIESSFRQGSYKDVEYYSTGYRDSINTYLNSNRLFWISDKRSIPEKLEALIIMESIKNSEMVGLPVDVIGLGNKTSVWYTKESKSRCY